VPLTDETRAEQGMKRNQNDQGSHPIINQHHLTLLLAYFGTQKAPEEEEIVDEKRRLPSPVRIKQNGRLNIVGMGAWYSYWRDPYHLLPPFLGLVPDTDCFRVFCCQPVCSGLPSGNCIANARPGNFLDAFFSASRLWPRSATA